MTVSWRGSRCCTTSTGIGNPTGSSPRTRLSAVIPPADAANATTAYRSAVPAEPGGASERLIVLTCLSLVTEAACRPRRAACALSIRHQITRTWTQPTADRPRTCGSARPAPRWLLPRRATPAVEGESWACYESGEGRKVAESAKLASALGAALCLIMFGDGGWVPATMAYARSDRRRLWLRA